MIRHPLTSPAISSPQLITFRGRLMEMEVSAFTSHDMFCLEPLIPLSVCFLPSPGFGPLCSWGKSLSLAGAGLPHGSPWLHPSAGHQRGQRAQVDLPKQRVSEAASGFGNETATQVMSNKSEEQMKVYKTPTVTCVPSCRTLSEC